MIPFRRMAFEPIALARDAGVGKGWLGRLRMVPYRLVARGNGSSKIEGEKASQECWNVFL